MTKISLRQYMPALIVLCSLAFKAPQLRKLPSAEVRTLSGKRVDASEIANEGKPMVVFVWEATCKPCIMEFNAVSREYANWKKNTGVKIVAISTDESRNASLVHSQSASKAWGFEIYLDPNQAFKRAMNVPFCPYVFVLNGNGEVVWQKSGYTPGDEHIIYDVVLKTSKGEKIDNQ
jgi:cytochrome c biogenesis protein CcmG/thiol:disulfide interchange protein DsbE